jgi:hypothetical protein
MALQVAFAGPLILNKPEKTMNARHLVKLLRWTQLQREINPESSLSVDRPPLLGPLRTVGAGGGDATADAVSSSSSSSSSSKKNGSSSSSSSASKKNSPADADKKNSSTQNNSTINNSDPWESIDPITGQMISPLPQFGTQTKPQQRSQQPSFSKISTSTSPNSSSARTKKSHGKPVNTANIKPSHNPHALTFIDNEPKFEFGPWYICWYLMALVPRADFSFKRLKKGWCHMCGYSEKTEDFISLSELNLGQRGNINDKSNFVGNTSERQVESRDGTLGKSSASSSSASVSAGSNPASTAAHAFNPSNRDFDMKDFDTQLPSSLTHQVVIYAKKIDGRIGSMEGSAIKDQGKDRYVRARADISGSR